MLYTFQVMAGNDLDLEPYTIRDSKGDAWPVNFFMSLIRLDAVKFRGYKIINNNQAVWTTSIRFPRNELIKF